MKRVLLLVFSVLVLGGLACEAPVPTATTVPDATSTPVPTPTSKPVLAPTPTPDSPLPSASYIVESAIENLRAASSFHVHIAVEEDWRVTTVKADIVAPNKGHFYTYRATDMLEYTIESISTEGERFMRPPGFKVWFFPAGGYDPRWSPRVFWSPRAFPFFLSSLSGIEDLTLRGSKVIGDITAYRITGTATNRLVGNMGAYMQTSARGEIVEVEIWISQEDLLPMRIEARFEEIEGSFRAIYSDFGAKYDITVTEKTLGEGSPILLFLWVGELSPEEREQLVRAFPAEEKECLEAEIGTDLYRKVLSGNSVADRVFLIALKFCERPIFSSRDDVIPNGITNNLYSLDLSALSILPGEKAEHVMECLRESIGLESLFEIGWEKRGPTPEEMAAAQMCKPRSEG